MRTLMRHSHKHSVAWTRGYTLIEIIATITAASLLALVAGVAWHNQTQQSLVSVAEQQGWSVAKLVQAQSSLDRAPVGEILAEYEPHSPGAIALGSLSYARDIPKTVSVLRITANGELRIHIQEYTCIGLQYSRILAGAAPTGKLRCQSDPQLLLLGVAPLVPNQPTEGGGNTPDAPTDLSASAAPQPSASPSPSQSSSPDPSPSAPGPETTPEPSDSPTAPASPSAPAIQVPSAPGIGSAVPGDERVRVTWTAPAADGGAPVTDYVVQYRIADGGSWITTSDSITTHTAVTVTGLANGSGYQFRVAAVNSAGTGPYSAASPIAVPATIAGAPTGVDAQGGDSSITVTWTAPAADGGAPVTDYLVETREASGPGPWVAFTHQVTPATTATITGLTNAVTYDVRISAVNAAGQGPASNIASATPDIAPAEAPVLSLTSGNTQLTASWTAPAVTGSAILDYIVQYRSGTSGPWTTLNDGVSLATSLTITGLLNTASYQVRVAAVNKAGTGAYSDPVLGSPDAAPTEPQNLVVLGSDGRVNATWAAPSGQFSTITDYLVAWRPQGGGAWVTVNDAVSVTPSASITGLANGVAVEVRVAAVNATGTGAWSTPLTATPHTTPDAPQAPGVTPATGRLDLTWPAPVSDGGAVIVDYVVSYRVSPAGAWTTFADGTTITPAASVTGLSNGVTYDVRVAAVNSSGQGPWSPVSTGVPFAAPDAPTGLGGAGGTAQVTLTWTTPGSNGSAITDYLVMYRVVGSGTWVSFADGVSTATTATVTGLGASTAYEFQVAAVNSAGVGAWSTPAFASPLFDPAGPAGPGSSGALDRALFSYASFAATNNFRVIQTTAPSAVYTHADFSCNTSARFDGYIHARGGATMTNSCRVGGLWTHSDVNTSTTGVRVDGNISVAAGSLRLSNTPMTIGGDVRVSGSIIASDGGTQTVGGAKYTGAAVQDSPDLSLPIVRYTTAAPAGWQAQTWTSFARAAGTTNGAPSWALTGDMCSVAGANYSVNGPLTSPVANTVLDARSCGELQFNGSAGALTLRLAGDLTIVANKFSSTGALSVVSADGATHKLRIVVPWTAGDSSNCSASGGGSLSFAAGGTSFSPLIPTLLYSAGSIALTNGMTMSGQIYGCSVNASNDVTLTYTQVGLPS